MCNPLSSASASTPDRDIPQHRALLRRRAVSLSAERLERQPKPAANAAFSTIRRAILKISHDNGLDWLPFLDTYRTMCLMPGPEFQRALDQIREMGQVVA
jgi:hypothetical protein